MEVYVTFNKDGYNGEQIEFIFKDESEAQDHIIKTRLSGGHYENMATHELQELALDYIEMHTIKQEVTKND